MYFVITSQVYRSSQLRLLSLNCVTTVNYTASHSEHYKLVYIVMNYFIVDMAQ